jgi:hypothetical protein
MPSNGDCRPPPAGAWASTAYVRHGRGFRHGHFARLQLGCGSGLGAHLWDWASAATSASRLRSHLSHLQLDWAHTCHICTRTRISDGARYDDGAINVGCALHMDGRSRRLLPCSCSYSLTATTSAKFWHSRPKFAELPLAPAAGPRWRTASVLRYSAVKLGSGRDWGSWLLGLGAGPAGSCVMSLQVTSGIRMRGECEGALYHFHCKLKARPVTGGACRRATKRRGCIILVCLELEQPRRFRTPCCTPTVRFNSRPHAAADATAPRRLASHAQHVRHGISRRIRAQHPRRMRAYVRTRKSSYSMQRLINQTPRNSDRLTQSARMKPQQAAGIPQRKQRSSNPCH